MIVLFASLTVGGFTLSPPPSSPEPRIEAIIQRGIISELIVKCVDGTAIISYSPTDGMYCLSPSNCSTDRLEIIDQSCGGAAKLK
jgi:hypothetical protein